MYFFERLRDDLRRGRADYFANHSIERMSCRLRRQATAHVKHLVAENMFKLEESDFEIDNNFRFSFDEGILNLDVCGDQKVFDIVTGDESHPYGWALYPPKFYIHDLPLGLDTDINNFEYMLTEDDVDAYEIDLYLMEYCTVFPCKVVGRNGMISIEGMVHGIKEELVPLCIKLKIT